MGADHHYDTLKCLVTSLLWNRIEGTFDRNQVTETPKTNIEF